MGTSQSSNGPGGGSPLVPPWADDQLQLPQPQPEPRRFKPFRQSLGAFVVSGSRNDLKRAIGHYARTASGGGGNAARRMGSVTQAGARLYGTISGAQIDQGETGVDLRRLVGLSCDEAISTISEALNTHDGDSNKVRVAMNRALIEALDGVEVFDPRHLTDNVIVDVMIGYLTECIFLQIVLDSNNAWNKAESPAQAIRAETDLRELIRVVVDKHLGPNLAGGARTFTQQQMIQIERKAVVDAWKEWEAYR